MTRGAVLVFITLLLGLILSGIGRFYDQTVAAEKVESADDRAPIGRHRLAVAHANGDGAASISVDCDELAAWLPETVERVERADEIVEEIGRLGADLDPSDFVAALKGFSAEFAVMAEAQATDEPPAGVLELNQELVTTFANFATVVREIADLLEYAQIALTEGATIDWSLLDEAWGLLPRLTDYLGLIVADLDQIAAGCGIDVARR